MITNRLFFLLLFFVVTATIDINAQSEKEISIRNIKSNLEFLADDLLEGREAASRGEKIASLFISQELAKYGVEPFGENSTYFQEFPMSLSGIEPDASIELKCIDKTVSLKLGNHYVYSSRNRPSVEYSGVAGEIVFAGYGITAEEFDYDDYRNLNVEGKFVLVFDDMPVSDNDTVFSQSKHRRYGFWSTKGKTAQKHGAAGVFIIPSDYTLEYWDYYAGVIKRPRFGIYDSTKTNINDYSSIPVAGLNREGVELLLENEIISAEELLKYFGSLELPESFTLKKTAAPKFSYFSRIKTARNVIGILEGHDDELKNEYVTIGAHYDHEGKIGDVVFNGADDNGSGTVGVLETARLLAEIKSNKRSILFLFYTGEEKGLLGSQYLSSNVDWINDAVVNINMDMIGRGSTDTLFCIGSDKLSTELYEVVEKVNDQGNYFTLDYRFNAENDPNRFYWRSDHVHFAEKGIPIVFFYDYMKADYHKPTDTVEKINLEKIYKVIGLVKGIVLDTTNRNEKLLVDKTFTR